MQLLTVGISHHRSPLELREQLVFLPDQVVASLRDLIRHEEISEAGIISTCNRTEIISAVTTEDSTATRDWFLSRFHGVRGSLTSCLEMYRGMHAVRHLFQVAGGLDSMILGEPQILGQVKQSYDIARNAGTVGRILNKAYQQSFAVGKLIRSSTDIGANPVSVAYAAVALSRQIFADLDSKSALLIGAGDTIRLVARHLRSAGIDRLTVANRTLSRARELADELNCQASTLSQVPELLIQADVVISSTNAELPILGKGAVEKVLKRKRRPILMVDLAVPRDIEPEVASLEDVYLYTVDDLESVVRQNLQSRQGAVQEAMRLVEAQLEDFADWYRSQKMVPMIKAYRNQIDRTRDQELHRALSDLRRGKDPEIILSRLANNLTNKLAHAPSVALRKAAQDGEMLERLSGLFGDGEERS